MNMRELIKKLSPGGAKGLYRFLRKHVIEAEFGLFHRFPIRKKRVVLCNVWGYGDNVKWIAKALREADKSVEVIFVTDRKKAEHVPAGIKLLQTNSLRAIWCLATAHVWVDCNRKEPYIIKRNGQIYIQTWHGSLPLKRLEKDYVKLSAAYLENAVRDSKMTDICLSNGDFMSDIYRKSFGYECEIALTGSARLDPLLRPREKRVIRTKNELAARAGIPAGPVRSGSRTEEESMAAEGQQGTPVQIRLAVYAPTYRENGKSFPLPDLERIVDALEAKFGGSFLMVTRMHPLVAGAGSYFKNGTYGSRIIDGNSSGDLYELLEAADVLITDYSNTLFEFGLCGKPVFLYAPDADEYEKERGMYFDYAKLPYPHSADTDGLVRCIEEFSLFDYKTGLNGFFRNIGVREDGRASRRIAELILRKVYRS